MIMKQQSKIPGGIVDEILFNAQQQARCNRDRDRDFGRDLPSNGRGRHRRMLHDHRKPGGAVCFVQQQHHGSSATTSSSSTAVDGDVLSTTTYHMTYNDLGLCVLDHQQWLVEQIQDKDDDEQVVIVAYLSTNTIDMVCSVLAATTRTSTSTTTTRTSRPPLLLNTRWTVKEIVDVLKPPKTATNGNGGGHGHGRRRVRRHKTLILYDSDIDDMKFIAKQVSDQLNNSNNNNNNKSSSNCSIDNYYSKKEEATANHQHQNYHICEFVPIPKLSKKYMVESSSSSSSNLSSSSRNVDKNNNIISRNSNFYDDMKYFDDDAIILFTSGTSEGRSKGVLLSHRALLVQSYAKIKTKMIKQGQHEQEEQQKTRTTTTTTTLYNNIADNNNNNNNGINRWGYDTSTTMLATTVPLFHVGGLSSFIAVLLAGGALVWPPPPRPPLQQQTSASSPLTLPPPPPTTKGKGKSNGVSFRVQDIISSIQHPLYPSNTLVVVPAMISSFFEEMTTTRKKGVAAASVDDNNHSIFPSVRLLLLGGQSAPSIMIEKMKYTFPNADIVQTYACTEAASSLTFLPLVLTDDKGQKSSSSCDEKDSSRSTTKTTIRPNTNTAASFFGGDCVGTPPNHIDLKLFRQEEDESNDTRPLIGEQEQKHLEKRIIRRPFEVGLIGSKGPHLMNGYWRRGQRIASGLTKTSKSSWYISGDLGYWDDRGRLYFSGRVKDVIRTGGETVMAQEVEGVIDKHPDVRECAVFARQDEKYGEAVSCALVLKGSNNDDKTVIIPPSLTSIKDWCRSKGLAGYKHPKFLFVVNELPRNSSGKLLKFKLVEMYGKPFRSKL